METKTTVEMTEQEKAEFAAFKAEKQRKEKLQREKEEREAYKTMVDDAIERALPTLKSISENIAFTKKAVMDEFRSALDMKQSIFGVKPEQRTHTFTNSNGDKRITLGQYVNDGYRDTVNEGIALVKEYLGSLAKDKDSEALVKAILRLMSRDQAGNLKASRVLQLRRMADESGNERFQEGVRIIEESYAPEVSKQFIRVETKEENGQWKSLPLGMTEA